MKNPQIMIAMAIRDRAWILPEFLKCLSNLAYPHELVSLYFLINNSTDETEEALLFEGNSDKEYKRLTIETTNSPSVPKDNRTSYIRTKYIYHHLVKLKNKIREKALEEEVDYLLLLESDVLFPPNLLTSLLSHQKNIVSPLIPVTIKKDRFNIMKKEKGKIWGKYPSYSHILSPESNTLLQTDMVGGVMLIKKNVLQKVEWIYSPQGEDCGFATNCKKKGFKMYCDSSVCCEHRMIKPNG